MSSAGEAYLEVSIHFDPRRISVGFRTEGQAILYYGLIQQRSFTRDMALDPTVSGRWVSVRLPSRVTDVVASTSCNGFYLCFSSTETASGWHRALLIWKFSAGSTSKLYVERDMPNRRLNEILGISEPPRAKGVSAAHTSAVRKL
ncbi:hypothetical protein JX266_007387 [Neoarthrinium moseri]|nr:hypothetical protein JX266_007387 [Neoarthrinium moseri]